MNQQYGYQNYQQQQQSHYEQSAPARHESVPDYAPPAEYRRPSLTQPPQQYPGTNHLVSPYSSSMDQYRQPQQMGQSLQSHQTSPHGHSIPTPMHTPNSHILPTLKTLQPPLAADKHEPVSPSYQSPPGSTSSGTMSSATMSAHPDSAPQNYGMNRFAVSGLPPVQTNVGQKRSFSSTFDTRHVNERLTGGARPNPNNYNYDTCDSPDMEEPMDRAAMSYRRADGTQRQRHVPEVGV